MHNSEINSQSELTIPQGWIEADLQPQQENDPVKEYEFSKSISIAALSLVLQLEAYKTSLPCKKGGLSLDMSKI
jgi:hypothetical protein